MGVQIDTEVPLKREAWGTGARDRQEGASAFSGQPSSIRPGAQMVSPVPGTNGQSVIGSFLAKQKRSLKKRRAELRDLLLRAAIRLPLNGHLRAVRETCELIRNSDLLEEVWYRKKHALLTSSRADPVLHYVLRGAAEGCDPNPLFDTQWYLEKNPQVRASRLNPLVHYIETGWKQGRKLNPDFDPGLYLQANPDVAASGLEPIFHYLRTGMKEGRPLAPRAKPFFGGEPEPLGSSVASDVRLIAFYLPQFHRIPENDRWWGEGFTEWRNVRRAQALFTDHYQPHAPHGEVGYYDLADESVLERQANMARCFGIHGFCFHHYWFGGKRLLEMPTERLLRTGKPDFPFCLCWANENWTRTWDGAEKEVLIAQQHSPQDDERFIRDLLRFFKDPRYIRVNGLPVLLIYRISLLPDPVATIERWRRVCRTEGLGEIFVLGVQGFDLIDPRPMGLDGAVEFPPHNCCEPLLSAPPFGSHNGFRGSCFDYSQVRWAVSKRRSFDYRLFRGVMPSWDNTPRRLQRASLFLNANPQDYYFWLNWAVRDTRERLRGEERLVFANAWNEWAEGCHLEPDERYGFAWLNATARAIVDCP
jgi:hypothetical protein